MRIVLERKDLLNKFKLKHLNEVDTRMFNLGTDLHYQADDIYLIDENENIVKVFKDRYNRISPNQFKVKLKKDFGYVDVQGFMKVLKKGTTLYYYSEIDEYKEVYSNISSDIKVKQKTVDDNPDYFEQIQPEKKYSKEDLKGFNSSINSIGIGNLRSLSYNGDAVNSFIDKLK